MIHADSMNLDGYPYALWPQQTGSVTRWVPYRQHLTSGRVEAMSRSFATEDVAYNALIFGELVTQLGQK